jgi:predicted transcriptional regulator
MLYELKRIKQMRRKLELTQSELAKLSGISQSLIAKIEQGSIEPSYSIARRIFIVLEEQIANIQKELAAINICSRDLVLIKSDDSIEKTIKLMKKHAISQIPVYKDNVIVGSISEETFINNYDKITNSDMKVEQIMDDPFPTVPMDTPSSLIRDILKTYSAVILMKNGKPRGIISKADLLKQL